MGDELIKTSEASSGADQRAVEALGRRKARKVVGRELFEG
jgi:hypothetical protein